MAKTTLDITYRYWGLGVAGWLDGRLWAFVPYGSYITPYKTWRDLVADTEIVWQRMTI